MHVIVILLYLALNVRVSENSQQKKKKRIPILYAELLNILVSTSFQRAPSTVCYNNNVIYRIIAKRANYFIRNYYLHLPDNIPNTERVITTVYYIIYIIIYRGYNYMHTENTDFAIFTFDLYASKCLITIIIITTSVR